MSDISMIPGLAELWDQTLGDNRICVAVLDGAVDLDHPAFTSADIARFDWVWPEEGYAGPSARHGTQVASVIFGQHDGPVRGVAPGCRGVSMPVFSDRRQKTSQLDIARGIELAVESGAHVINISGGQLTTSGEAEDFLSRAVRLCEERNVLVVAAAGNDGCFCEHVPAALPSVLAVGALDDAGRPLASSNWGRKYQEQGILAPGENILSAIPGGTTVRATGTSLATPIVTGVAALLLSLQVRSGRKPDPLGVRAALLAGAEPCELGDPDACRRFLAGKLNIRRTVSAVQNEPTEAVVQSCGCGGAPAEPSEDESPATRTEQTERRPAAAGVATSTTSTTSSTAPATSVESSGQITLSEPPPPPLPTPPPTPPGLRWDPYVYALGTLGYDFGTEARRDSFKQLMAPVAVEDTVIPANPYDARQMVGHLAAHPSESRTLIWTLNLELTPIYAIEPTGPYAATIYEQLTHLLTGEIAAENNENYIERVSIPGRLTDRTIKLFSGQILPIIEIEQTRGVYGWQINTLINAATHAAQQLPDTPPDVNLDNPLREFLTRVYYDLRNLGATSRDRALNFAATNAFQAAHTFAAAVAAGMALDTINVEKSPYCRMDSDCWDVRLRFFDPENSRRARKVFRFTIDVSDILPVTLGDVRTWSEAG